MIKLYMPQPTLITTYYALFLLVMTNGIIFWGNSTHSSKIFKNYNGKKEQGDACRNLFKELTMLPLKSQYILFYFYL